MFYRETKKSKISQPKPITHLYAVKHAKELLQEPKRQELLQRIALFSCLELDRFEKLGLSLIHHVVHICQQLPDSSYRYYADAGGLVDYFLNRTEAALDLMQAFLKVDHDASPTEEQKIWVYALFSAGFLQCLGKLYIDYDVKIFDKYGHFSKEWNPLIQPFSSADLYYDYRMLNDHKPELRRHLTLLLAQQLMPEEGLVWLADHKEIFELWLALLHEDEHLAGTLGAIFNRAKAMAQQRSMHDFVKKSDPARAKKAHQINTFADGRPESLQDKDRLLGAEFIEWLRLNVASGKIVMNRTPGCILTPAGLLLSLDLFRQFALEHPQVKNWRTVQRAFETWGLHHDVAQQTDAKKQQNLLVDVAILPAQVHVYDSHAQLDLCLSGVDVIQFIASKGQSILPAKQQLSAQGEWRDMPVSPSHFLSGNKTRGG